MNRFAFCLYILLYISCGENKVSTRHEIYNTPKFIVREISYKKPAIISTEKFKSDYYPDTTPLPVNPWRTKVGWEINDTDASIVLKKIIPAYWYHEEGQGELGFWECENCKPVTFHETNYIDNHSIDTFPRKGDSFWTKLLGTSTFNWKGKRHWLLAFNTANDPMGAGRFIGGKLGMAIFSYEGLRQWKLVYYNPIVGGFGNFQNCPMPVVKIVNDSNIYFMIEHSGCLPYAWPCYKDLYLFNPTNLGFSHISSIYFLEHQQQQGNTNWRSTINNDSNIEIISEGEFDASAKEYHDKPKILFDELKKRHDKPFKFTWKRTYEFKDNTWELLYEKLIVK